MPRRICMHARGSGSCLGRSFVKMEVPRTAPFFFAWWQSVGADCLDQPQGSRLNLKASARALGPWLMFGCSFARNVPPRTHMQKRKHTHTRSRSHHSRIFMCLSRPIKSSRSPQQAIASRGRLLSPPSNAPLANQRYCARTRKTHNNTNITLQPAIPSTYTNTAPELEAKNKHSASTRNMSTNPGHRGG